MNTEIRIPGLAEGRLTQKWKYKKKLKNRSECEQKQR